jgi:PH (Pleckstrin Homology) domain-containing protein
MSDLVTYEYEYCPLRSRAHRMARIVPPIRPLAALTWPAARRADRVELSEDGLRVRSLAGYTRIGWDEIGAVHRSRTTWGRMTLHVVASGPSRHIEIAESMPGFDDLVATILHNAGMAEVVPLRAAA